MLAMALSIKSAKVPLALGLVSLSVSEDPTHSRCASDSPDVAAAA